MPFALLAADGSIDALLPHAVEGSAFLPATDPRVLDLLLAGDSGGAQGLLDASDRSQRLLLDSLLLALSEAGRLAADDVRRLAAPRPEERVQRLQTLRERVESDDEAVRQSLNDSDAGAVRLIEDVIDLLEQKGMLRRAELPPGAQTLLRLRHELRAYLSDDEAEPDGTD